MESIKYNYFSVNQAGFVEGRIMNASRRGGKICRRQRNENTRASVVERVTVLLLEWRPVLFSSTKSTVDLVD